MTAASSPRPQAATVDLTVVERRAKKNSTLLRLSDGTFTELHRFAPVGKGDTVRRQDGELLAILGCGSSLPISTPWSMSATLAVGDESLDVLLKEATTVEELDGLQRLTEYHYRGSAGAGRRVPIIPRIESWELPPIVGFIELTTSFLVNIARKKVFDTRFSDPDRGIAWGSWDTKSAKSYANSVVRISRCVVFPEMRGLGLSTILVDAACKYAATRWHVGDRRPSFIEITADMLRYWPFVRQAGFVFIGETEGNADRAVKDMQYLIRRSKNGKGMPKGGGGIMTLQRSYATHLSEVMKARGLTLHQLLGLLKQSPERLPDDEWIALHQVLRHPKPTYMKGLTPAAEAMLRARSGIVGAGRTTNTPPKSTPFSSVSIRGLRLSVVASPVPSERTRKVQEAFGIVAKSFESTLVREADFDLQAGQIILIGGPSGTGKSLLLQGLQALLSGEPHPVTGVTLTAKAEEHALCRIVSLTQPETQRTPIDLLSSLSLEESLATLADAGLAEPQLFVRPSGTLSVGQRYRLSIAVALSAKPDILLIDEFCEVLDRFSTAAVCRKLRKVAERGVVVVAATASPHRVASFLRPHRTLFLCSDGGARWTDKEAER